jgi:gluconolactonase
LICFLTASLGAESLLNGELRILGDDFQFTEGPAADAEGNVYFTDLKPERIYVYTLDGQTELVMEDSGRANGLYFDPDGNRLACEGGRGRVTSTAPDGTMTVLSAEYNGAPFNKPNDLWLDSKGGIYFTDPAYGKTVLHQGDECLYYIQPNGSGTIRIDEDYVRPNGVIGTPDGKTLYVADAGAEKIWKYAINADGTLSDKTLFAGVRCDGMTMDEKGNLYVTPGPVQIYGLDGTLLEIIELPNRATNVTFGGEENNTLFITARTHLCAVEMAVRGAE